MALVQSLTNKLIVPTVLRGVRNSSRWAPSLFNSPMGRRSRSLIDLHPMDLWRRDRDPFAAFFPASRFDIYFDRPFEPLDYYNTFNPKEDFQVSLDVGHFAPNEIKVKLADNAIVVEAKHEERTDDDGEGHGFVSRHFTRRYVLPEQFNIEDVQSSLSSDGILTLKAPLKQSAKEAENTRDIPVQQTGPARLNVNKPEKAADAENKESEKKN